MFLINQIISRLFKKIILLMLRESIIAIKIGLREWVDLKFALLLFYSFLIVLLLPRSRKIVFYCNLLFVYFFYKALTSVWKIEWPSKQRPPSKFLVVNIVHEEWGLMLNLLIHYSLFRNRFDYLDSQKEPV